MSNEAVHCRNQHVRREVAWRGHANQEKHWEGIMALRASSASAARRPTRLLGAAGAFAFAVAMAVAPATTSAQNSEPIRIGFSLALTGPLAPNGKQALLGAKIWEEEINAKGGLLGRKVELINYDDQSNPANIPGIYTKLLDVDKVDLVNGPYGTNLIAPALPVVMQKGKLLIGLFGLDANKEFHYTRYFSMISAGPQPSRAFTEGYFQVAAQQKPKPQTVATRSSLAMLARAPAKTPRRSGSKSSTTKPSHRAPPTSRRSFAHWSLPTPISW
jgi:branched-chain amino acid transport system substrate-binding protein